jgi:hypothetical protein
MFGLFTWMFMAIEGEVRGQVMFDHHLAQLVSSGVPQAEIDAQIAEMEAMKWLFFDAKFHGVVMFATVFLIGVAESVVGALIVRRR